MPAAIGLALIEAATPLLGLGGAEILSATTIAGIGLPSIIGSTAILGSPIGEFEKLSNADGEVA